ncbi:hypothetical protein C2R22_05770 [Salinigranum rubrum]|uniref:Ribbon-helix-helix protein CopG domain-containing protein n=1 Tax=Salinigranum rubrum TaxID=755307 RepID=A0A2I8VH15_9EURY|nr:ribbon-helix-helix protein, CopG family [Salinigranum rubrum]AUV81226.1 hypothetical protein C2R22_05770 [Salinigranum rubrum]
MKRDKRIQTSVTQDVKRDFRVAAAEQDMDMSELLRELIHEYLDERKGAEEGNPNALTQTAD